MSPSDDASCPPPGDMSEAAATDDVINRRLGDVLRTLLADSIEEPLPESFRLLLERLEAEERGGRKSE